MISSLDHQNITGLDATVGNNPLTDQLSIRQCEIFDSTFTIFDPRTLRIYCSSLTRTTFCMKKVGSLKCFNVFFKDCIFTGRYFDAQFGVNTFLPEQCPQRGGLENCDFSKSCLHLCELFNAKLDTIILPKWPHFTVVNPSLNANDWLAIPLPMNFRNIQEAIALPTTEKIASTIHWPTYAQQNNDATDPEIIRQLLTGKDYIKM